MAAERIGVAGFTEENRIFYEKQLLVRAMPALAHVGWGLAKDIPRHGGNSIDFRRFERPTAATTALTEGTPPSATNLTVAAVPLTVLQYGEWDRYSDVLENQGVDDVVSGMTGAFGDNMGVTIDVLCRNVIVAGTNVAYANSVGSRGAVAFSSTYLLSASLLKVAARELQAANGRPIPKAGGNYVAFVHPDGWEDLLNDTQIQNALQYAAMRGDANPLFTGAQFDFAGIRLVRTSNARVFGSAGLSTALGSGPPAVYATVVAAEEAYGEVRFGDDNVRLKVKAVGSAGATDPLDQYGSVGWKASYGAVRLNENFLYRVEHAATANRQAGNATP